ncbi:hypothetical protein P8452_02315 [Trifolium repens]|nr:hypothetical protein P8452_02315 [Trifolium repens]
MPSSHCLSTAREIMNLHDQAVQDYSHIDNSNTLFILRDIDPTVQSYSLMTKTCFVEFDPMNPRAKRWIRSLDTHLEWILQNRTS